MTIDQTDGRILDQLFSLVEARKGDDPAKSYTAALYARGPEKIAQKVGEEAVETVIAALAQGRDALIMESADLLYHLAVLWADRGVEPAAIYRELARRHGEKTGAAGASESKEE